MLVHHHCANKGSAELVIADCVLFCARSTCDDVAVLTAKVVLFAFHASILLPVSIAATTPSKYACCF